MLPVAFPTIAIGGMVYFSLVASFTALYKAISVPRFHVSWAAN
jgi:hypothetical protein